MSIQSIIIIATVLVAAAAAPLVVFLRGKRTLKRMKIALAINLTVFFGGMILLLIIGLSRGGA